MTSLGRPLALVIALAACQASRGASTPHAVVTQAVIALDRGDAGAVKRLRIRSDELRRYGNCTDAKGSAWAFLDAFEDGVIDAAAAALRGHAGDLELEPNTLRELKVGDPIDEECTAARPYATQDFSTMVFLDGEEQPLHLTVGRFDDGWRLVFVSFGRGFNH